MHNKVLMGQHLKESPHEDKQALAQTRIEESIVFVSLNINSLTLYEQLLKKLKLQFALCHISYKSKVICFIQ